MEELKDEYVLILKMHYLIMDNIDLSKYKGFAYAYSSNQDIQELYLVSDMLITDYSSVMFDYSILRRPMIFFAYDIEKYKEQIRGFYFNLEEEAPGPIVKDSIDLVKSVKKCGEDAKVAIRSIRRDANDKIKSLKKNSEISEDESKKAEDQIQKETDKFIKLIDKTVEEKEKSIMSV